MIHVENEPIALQLLMRPPLIKGGLYMFKQVSILPNMKKDEP